ncbi:MAG: CmcI family methyltransferase [Thermoleophilaceae bacterium]
MSARPVDLPREFAWLLYELSDQTWMNAEWLGVKALKLPFDMWVQQEIIVETRPDVIVETGTYSGGSALFFATVLDALGHGEVITIDVDHAPLHAKVVEHPRVDAIRGGSTDPDVVSSVSQRVRGQRTMVILDSDHSAAHVSAELEVLSPLVSPGCYLIVEDTSVNGNPVLPDFGPGPAEALAEWLPMAEDFEVDPSREKFMVTFHPGGYLRRLPAGSRRREPSTEPDDPFSGTEQPLESTDDDLGASGVDYLKMELGRARARLERERSRRERAEEEVTRAKARRKRAERDKKKALSQLTAVERSGLFRIRTALLSVHQTARTAGRRVRRGGER